MRLAGVQAGLAGLVLAGCILMPVAAEGQIAYQKPPKEILEVLNAPLPPLILVSPAKDRLLLLDRVAYPPIAELARPFERLAGLRIDPANNGRHAPAVYTGVRLRGVESSIEGVSLALPKGARIGDVAWSQNGTYFAFPLYQADRIELWVAETATARARRVPGVALNDTVSAAFEWLPDGKTLLALTIPGGRPVPPAAPQSPAGPTVQESDGSAGPVRTYQDLLENSHDEDLFEYFATSQPTLIDASTLERRPFLEKGIYTEITASPDGMHFLVERIHRPFSFLLPYYRFPLTADVVDRNGVREYRIAEEPLQDRIPIEGVKTGPRSYSWLPWSGATLVWVEALDGGDPRAKAANRDRVMLLDAPFAEQARGWLKVEQRFAGLTWLETKDAALLRDYDRDKRWTRTYLVNVAAGGTPAEPIFSRNIRDRYNDEGVPLRKLLSNGFSVAIHHGGKLLLSGAGANPNGDRPFLDRFDLASRAKERLFESAPNAYEYAVSALADDGSRFLTSRESSAVPPNLVLRAKGAPERAITNFKDPTPQLRGISKRIVKYERRDGTQLSFTLYLPAGYKEGTRLPALVWAYPLEFSDPATAGQVTGSENRFTSIRGYSHLFFLLAGYAVLDDTAMPVVGPPETANDTFIRQVVESAEAAIGKAAELGVVDPDRVAVGGHSYGAFMTANLLAHSRLFRAGIARSGAYNRTLTPFGFQAERRTYWEAPEIYYQLSPFSAAEQIKDPLLLIHGEADNNAGTFPIQSERMYQAVRGTGGIARLVLLPHESHGYRALESIEHVLWESLGWLDKYVKNAQPRETAPGARDAGPR